MTATASMSAGKTKEPLMLIRNLFIGGAGAGAAVVLALFGLSEVAFVTSPKHP